MIRVYSRLTLIMYSRFPLVVAMILMCFRLTYVVDMFLQGNHHTEPARLHVIEKPASHQAYSLTQEALHELFLALPVRGREELIASPDQLERGVGEGKNGMKGEIYS
ncbi:hypothetical protein PoB_005496300 [Plakobranchus ocellatus]|uniref:Uncharacterized protein n=1 Tax=Plakobranchus ocellatus TaxID=259542 RepID=A0AAV4CAC5_9GAST|nr:hypothetical protein PoB_005496300 [Plakobranchus ocellatus]